MPAGTIRGTALRVTCVTTRAGLDQLRPEWDVLWASVPDRTPFQHSAWLLPWIDQFVEDGVRVLAMRHDCRLVGLAPFYLSRRNGRCELRLLGTGISDYLDVLAAPPWAGDAADAVGAFLADTADEWSFCALDHLRPGSVLRRIRAPFPCRDLLTPDEPCPVVFLPAGDRVSARMRKCRRRAKRYGDIVVEHATRDTVLSFLSTLFALHGARWAAAGTAGVLADERVREFHCAAAPALLDAGMLRLILVRVGGRIAAAHYGLRAAGRAFFYIGGFDPAFSAISPGKLAVAVAMEQAIAGGASTFDFLGGREPYKYEWGASDSFRINRCLTRGRER